MASLIGNPLHIYNYQSKRSRGSISPFYQHNCDVKTAQYILGREDAKVGAEEWKELAQRLYKSTIKSWTNSSDYLISATNTVIDWNSTIELASFTDLKGFIGMNTLLDWQKDFVNILKGKEYTAGIYFFKYMGNHHVWVTINDPSTNIILDYSNSYIKFLEEHPDLNFEFMTFGKQEIKGTPVPEQSIYINCEE